MATEALRSDSPTSYCEEFLPRAVLQRLEAGAYQRLCSHLRERSEEVQNIDLMTLSGFCRNCLAKWLVVEARLLSDEMKATGLNESNDNMVVRSLDALGYDEAAQHVYGMGYGEWKKRYSKKASDEVMERFNASKALWAKHDKTILAKRSEKPKQPSDSKSNTTSTNSGGESGALMSSVCCQDPDEVAIKEKENVTKESAPRDTRLVNPKTLVCPNITGFSCSVAILTVSDRASVGAYEAGDLSGPAVHEALKAAASTLSNDDIVCLNAAIVPDSIDAIGAKLKEFSESTAGIGLVLTTGGTGFSPRDVTPEATRAILDRECEGLMTYVTTECSLLQPLASLSRATAGIRNNTFIANLPGNPKAASEIIPILLPLALHVVADLQANK